MGDRRVVSTRGRQTTWLLLCLSANLAVLSAPVRAQGEPTAPPAGDVLEDLALLSVAGRLKLTPRQIKKVIPLLQDVQADQAALEAARQQALADRRDDFRAVEEAYLSGEEPPRACLERINASLAKVRAAEQEAEAKLTRREARLLGYFTRDQVRLIETEQQYLAAQKRRQKLEGAASAAEYVVNKLSEVRELLPEEYRAQAAPLAAQVAVVVKGPRFRHLPAVKERVLYLFEQVRRMSQQEFETTLPTMPEQVSKLLDLPATQPTTTTKISREEFLRFLKSPRTVELLSQLLTSAQEEQE